MPLPAPNDDVPAGQRAGPLAAHTPDAAPAVPDLVEQLTAREREVLGLLAAGTTNPRIAEELAVTLDTVKKHVSHLLDKLGAANRTEAVTRARQLGPDPPAASEPTGAEDSTSVCTSG